MNKNINYYNNNAQTFYDRTINADISNGYKKFLKYLPEKSHILDAGCGVGRDSKYLLSLGHQVTAFDASEELVKIASKETNLAVIHMMFQDMVFDQIFDGVWAQASLIHVPYDETKHIYRNIYKALKPGGIFYASYKYGQNQMSMEGRDFWNMDESSIKPYLDGIFDIIEIWTEKDIISTITPSPNKMWLNFVARKL